MEVQLMVTEAYCDFETAKLLKEKGFNEKCFRTYFNDGIISRIFDDNDEIYNENLIPSVVAAPTLQMAMKWLREIHKYHINVFVGSDREDIDDVYTHEWYFWSYNISNLQGDVIYDAYEKFDVVEYDTYEEACEAAIKYVLENLI